MPIPAPEPGLVISYSYLWRHEVGRGKAEGVKDRPAVVALAVERESDGAVFVTVLPITHLRPGIDPAAVEIPAPVKRNLGLDSERSWVIVTEGNRFIWPGYDLRRVVGTSRFDHGFLPPAFFAKVLAAFTAWHETAKAGLTSRD